MEPGEAAHRISACERRKCLENDSGAMHAAPSAILRSRVHSPPRSFLDTPTVWQESDTTTEEDITMFRFLQRFGRDYRQEGAAPGHRADDPCGDATMRLNCEALEGRQMLSGYYIVNVASGKVLDDPAARPATDRHRQWQPNGGPTSSGTSSR